MPQRKLVEAQLLLECRASSCTGTPHRASPLVCVIVSISCGAQSGAPCVVIVVTVAPCVVTVLIVPPPAHRASPIIIRTGNPPLVHWVLDVFILGRPAVRASSVWIHILLPLPDGLACRLIQVRTFSPKKVTISPCWAPSRANITIVSRLHVGPPTIAILTLVPSMVILLISRAKHVSGPGVIFPFAWASVLAFSLGSVVSFSGAAVINVVRPVITFTRASVFTLPGTTSRGSIRPFSWTSVFLQFSGPDHKL